MSWFLCLHLVNRFDNLSQDGGDFRSLLLNLAFEDLYSSSLKMML